MEVFYLWCIWVRRVPLSSLVEADFHAFRDFIARPPADWVQARRVERSSDEWRPLRGPVGPASQRHLFTVLGALFRALVDAGYLSVHAVAGVQPTLKVPRASLNIRRSFPEAHWAWLLRTLDAEPSTAFTRRTRLVLELGATAGLRLSELATARWGDLRCESVAGQDVWLLQVVGKGGKARDVVIAPHVLQLIEQHQQDLDATGVGFDARAPLRTLQAGAVSVNDSVAVPAAAEETLQSDQAFDIAGDDEGALRGTRPVQRPLVGALRSPVPRWVPGEGGTPQLHATPVRGDAWGALAPGALRESLKRLFARAARSAHLADPPLDPSVFKSATTHWLRHFFANCAAEDGVTVTVLRDALGHADVGTTSVYLRSELNALVHEMGKMKRRG